MLLGILAFSQRQLLERGQSWSGDQDHWLLEVSIMCHITRGLKQELPGTFGKTYQLKRNGVVPLVNGEIGFRLVVPDL